MFVCPQCGNEVIGKLEDHYRFYPECGIAAKRSTAGTTNTNPRNLADPKTVYTASLLLEATRDIAMLKEPDYKVKGLTPRTMKDYLQWLGEMLPSAMKRIQQRPKNDEFDNVKAKWG